jgi:hypothetical protein
MTILLLIALGYLPPLIIGLWWVLTTGNATIFDETDGLIVLPILNWLYLGITIPEIIGHLKKNYKLTWEDE